MVLAGDASVPRLLGQTAKLEEALGALKVVLAGGMKADGLAASGVGAQTDAGVEGKVDVCLEFTVLI